MSKDINKFRGDEFNSTRTRIFSGHTARVIDQGQTVSVPPASLENGPEWLAHDIRQAIANGAARKVSSQKGIELAKSRGKRVFRLLSHGGPLGGWTAVKEL